jgi:hypothetical protein
MADIAAGRYKGKAVKGSEQYNMLEGKAPCVAIDLKIASAAGDVFMTTFLYFSEAAAPYSYERLRALGWKGTGPADLADLSTLDQEVDIEVTKEVYEGKERTKANILTGASRVTLTDKVDPKIFAAKVAAMLGNSGAAAPAQSGVKPPF